MIRRIPFAAVFPGLALPFALMLAAPVHAAPLAPQQQAVHVLNRLAFGPRPGDVERIGDLGVQRWIDEQLQPEAIPLPPALAARLQQLDTVNRSAGASLAEFLELRKEAKDEGEEAKQRRRQRQAQIEREAAEARLLRAIDSPRQLEEVMVDFWYNHFNVFAGKGIDRALVASYERDAIRPHALGSFRDLLGATAKHPAMLFYLDNAVSRAGGVNENYARELMELHTLGVDGGYTQRDVTELARMLTGWTFDQRRLAAGRDTFRFDARRHDRGAKTWLGQTIEAAGQQEGERALDLLALHPTTARHVSRRLAQYFVSDDPPAALVERMVAAWRAGGGDIRAVLRALFASDEFMSTQALGAKFKTPYQFVVSAVRAGAVPVANVAPLASAMNQLGMPLYGCQTPDGYKNTQAAWLNPDALTRRIGFASALAGGRLALAAAAPLPAAAPPVSRTPGDAIALAPRPPVSVAAPTPTPMPPLDPAQLQATLAGSISDRTLGITRQHPENLRGAMLLGSPDFMQR